MKDNALYTGIVSRKQRGQKAFALLIDPDKHAVEEIRGIAAAAEKAGADYIFIGGSLLVQHTMDACIEAIKKEFTQPVIIFPGSVQQVSGRADGILFLSVISGRNAEMLIGRQVMAAPLLMQLPLEVMGTGYMLIDSGRTTTAIYMSNTSPIPYEKNDIACCTALAGEMLGMKLLYMDGGSGAERPISAEMIGEVARHTTIPLIIGGGIRTPEQAVAACVAGADIIVTGNAAEKDRELIATIAAAVHALNR